jgi:excisionase family DNA binding protein
MENQNAKKKLETNYNQIKRPFITLEEASVYLGLTKATLYSYTHKRIIPFYKIRGRRVYFKIEDLDNFILNETNLVKSEQQIEAEAISNIFNGKV